MDAAAIALLQDLLIGARCSELAVKHGFLELVLGKHRLVVHCAWRIVQEQLLAGSGESSYVRAEDALILQQVTIVNVQGPFHDLQVEFEGGASLETFADSAEHESWHLFGEDERVLVAGPGLLWTRF
jgi:hypothetical protein